MLLFFLQSKPACPLRILLLQHPLKYNGFVFQYTLFCYFRKDTWDFNNVKNVFFFPGAISYLIFKLRALQVGFDSRDGEWPCSWMKCFDGYCQLWCKLSKNSNLSVAEFSVILQCEVATGSRDSFSCCCLAGILSSLVVIPSSMTRKLVNYGRMVSVRL